MHKKALLLGVAITFFICIAATSSPPIQPGGTIVSATPTEIHTLNPYLTTDTETSSYSRLINAGLTRLNPLTNEPEPWLAEKWTSSSNELEWTFELRKGIRWSDGHPFTAEDVLFTMQIVNDPSIQSSAKDALSVEKQPAQWSALSSTTVRAVLPAKHVTFLRHLEARICPILAKHAWNNLYKSGRFAETMRPTAGTFPCLGPFQLKSFAAGQKLVLSRNPYFWKMDVHRKQLPYIEELIFLILANQDQLQLKIETGEIDTYQNIRPSDVDRLKEYAGKLKMKVLNLGPSLEMEGLIFNQNRGLDPGTGKPYVDPVKLAWFTDQNFRKAISFAIDRQAMVRSALFGYGIPAYGPESPGNKQWFYPDLPKNKMDLRTARAMLAKSGFREKKNESGKPELYDRHGNRVRFSLFTNSRNTIRNSQCILIVSDLAKIGIEVNLQVLEFSTLLQHIDRTFQYDAALVGLNRSDMDPGERRNMLISNGSLHFWWPRQEKPFTPWEKRIDELMRRTMSTSDLPSRQKHYFEVQKILAEQQPMIFTIHPFGFACARNGIGNLKPTVLRHRTLWNAEELYWQR